MDYIREHGSVQVDQLSNHLRVTPQTIRCDLNQLYEQQLLQRVHGGAVVKDNVENLGYGARKILMAEEKSDIAQRVAELLPDNSSLFINIGTTTERVAGFFERQDFQRVNPERIPDDKWRHYDALRRPRVRCLLREIPPAK